jgi:acetyltransferase
VYKDRALALPPLTTTLARRMMEGTRIFGALGGVRGRAPVDVGALEKLLVRFSQLVVEQPWIKELDINPLLASPERLIALDARVVLHDPQTAEEDLPQTAIRPYPIQYVSEEETPDGERVRVRPIRPEDEPLMVRFHESLSEQSVYMRYFHMMKLDQRTAHERLTRICFIDYDREMALVAERTDPRPGSARSWASPASPATGPTPPRRSSPSSSATASSAGASAPSSSDASSRSAGPKTSGASPPRSCWTTAPCNA